MKKRHLIIGVGLITLSSILGGYGTAIATETQKNLQQPDQPISTLESKLANVVADVHSRLEKSELTIADYNTFLFLSLEKEGMLEDLEIALIYPDYRDNQRYMQAIIHEKLGVKGERGIKNDYYILPNSQISEEAKKDINLYKKLKTEVGKYLRQTIGENPISKDNFEELIRNYVSQTPYVSQQLSDWDSYPLARIVLRIVPSLIETYKEEFKITPQSEWIGKYPKETIRKALEK